MVLPRTHRARTPVTPRALTCIGKSIRPFLTPAPGVCTRALGASARNTEVADLRSEESDLQPTASHRQPEHIPCPGTQIYTRMLPRRIGMAQLASQLHGRLHVQSKTVRYSIILSLLFLFTFPPVQLSPHSFFKLTIRHIACQIVIQPTCKAKDSFS